MRLLYEKFVILFSYEIGCLYSAFLVDIISPVGRTTEYQGTLRLSGPAMDLAVEQLHQQYGNAFQIRHTYIYEINSTSCERQADSMVDSSEKFYFLDKEPSIQLISNYSFQVHYIKLPLNQGLIVSLSCLMTCRTA